MMRTEFTALQEGKKTVSEVLELLQVKGEELLAQESWSDEEMNKYYEKLYGNQQEIMNEAAGVTSEDETTSE
ncbi:hypothetical protein D3C85_1856670 [compost metagenome]